MHPSAHVEARDNTVEWVLSFHCDMGSGDQSQVAKPLGEYLYLLSISLAQKECS